MKSRVAPFREIPLEGEVLVFDVDDSHREANPPGTCPADGWYALEDGDGTVIYAATQALACYLQRLIRVDQGLDPLTGGRPIKARIDEAPSRFVG